MLKNVLCLCALSSAITFCAYADQVKEAASDAAIIETPAEAPVLDTTQEPALAGCGCKGKDKNKQNDQLACCGEEVEEPVETVAPAVPEVQPAALLANAEECVEEKVLVVPTEEKQQDVTACAKCGNLKHRLLAVEEQNSETEVLISLPEEEVQAA